MEAKLLPISDEEISKSILFKDLQFDMEQTKVYNPSALDVWVRIRAHGAEERFVHVPCGQTVELP